MARRHIVHQVPRTAIPLQSLRPADLKAAEALLNEGKLSLLTVGIGRSRRQFLVPTPPPSSTAKTEQ